MTRYPTIAKFALEDNSDWGSKICCPFCGYSYTRTGGPMESVGSGDYEAWSGRGSADVLRFEGECGHTWMLVLGFHKGETFLTVSAPIKTAESDW